MDVDFGTSVSWGNDSELFLRISSRYFDRERPVVDAWGPRFHDPDDLAVFFFLSRHSGKTPEAIFALRRQGLTWFDIGLRIGVPVDAWFIPVSADPGPPYGNAYGQWKKHRKNPVRRPKINDAAARDLVAARMLHEYYRLPAETAFELRASGGTVRQLLCAEYESRHGKGMSASKPKPQRVEPRDKKEDRHHH